MLRCFDRDPVVAAFNPQERGIRDRKNLREFTGAYLIFHHEVSDLGREFYLAKIFEKMS